MTWPHKPAEDFSYEESAVNWGVDRDPDSQAAPSTLGRLLWIIITIIIILSLIIPWIAPYLAPRRPLVDPDILAFLYESIPL